MSVRGSFAGLLILALGAPAVADAQDPPPPQPAPDPIDGNVVEVMEEEGNYEMLLEAFEAAGLLQTLQVDEGPLTILAPTDEAFEALAEEERQQLFQSPQELQNMLAYHVVPATAMDSDELAQSPQVETLLGLPLDVQAQEDQLTIGNATVEEPDVDAANGMLHGIDEVLTPQGPQAPGNR